LPPGSSVPGDGVIADLPVDTEAEDEAQRLRHLIVGPGDMKLRSKAIGDLAALNSPDATRELEASLNVHEPELRQEVVMALGQSYGDKPPTGLGQVVMGDKDARVREAAIVALAELGSEVARLFIEQALKDPEESVREAARIALSEMPKR
jgi:HEAT repeat protein